MSTKLENIVLRFYIPYVIPLNVYRTAARFSSNFKHSLVYIRDVIRGPQQELLTLRQCELSVLMWRWLLWYVLSKVAMYRRQEEEHIFRKYVEKKHPVFRILS